MRLDVEGTEMLALRGAEAVLRRSPRLRIVLEWSPVMLRSHCDPAAEVAWLGGMGFRCWRIARRRYDPFRPWRLQPMELAALPDAPHGEVLLARGDPG
jgi:hypothetical protein